MTKLPISASRRAQCVTAQVTVREGTQLTNVRALLASAVCEINVIQSKEVSALTVLYVRVLEQDLVRVICANGELKLLPHVPLGGWIKDGKAVPSCFLGKNREFESGDGVHDVVELHALHPGPFVHRRL